MTVVVTKEQLPHLGHDCSCNEQNQSIFHINCLWLILQRWHFPTPYTECVCSERMSVNGEKVVVFSNERELDFFFKITHKVSCLYLLWFVCESIRKLKKIAFLAGEKKTSHKWQNGNFLFHVISWSSKQYPTGDFC